MSQYTLTYFSKRGRGEQVRLLLHELGLEFAERNFPGGGSPEFKAYREGNPATLAFGSVPMLEDGDFRLVQGPVILSYIARKHGLAPADLRLAAHADSIALGAEDLRSQYFRLFGEKGAERQAEFVAGPWRTRWLPAFDGLLERNGDNGFFVGTSLTHADVAVWDAFDAILTWVAGASLEGSPRLQRFYAAFQERPRIAAYLASGKRPKG